MGDHAARWRNGSGRGSCLAGDHGSCFGRARTSRPADTPHPVIVFHEAITEDAVPMVDGSTQPFAFGVVENRKSKRVARSDGVFRLTHYRRCPLTQRSCFSRNRAAGLARHQTGGVRPRCAANSVFPPDQPLHPLFTRKRRRESVFPHGSLFRGPSQPATRQNPCNSRTR